MRGSLKQRSQGSWTLRVDDGIDPKTGGRRQRVETFRGSKHEAEARLAEFVLEVKHGTVLDARHLTVADYFAQWLVVTETRVKGRTFCRYESDVRLHVVPVIGSIKLAKLGPLNLEQVYAAGREKGLTERSLLNVHRVMFSALRQAVRWQLIARNVAEAVAAPKPTRRRVEPMESSDARGLLEAMAGSFLELPTVIGLGTGMRLGEVLGLRWIDVDLDKGTARIAQALQPGGTFDRPKTHRSSRSVSLPAFVIDALRAYRVAQSERRLALGANWHDVALIIERGDGRPCDLRRVSREFSEAARLAGFDLTFHGLRHGFASLQLAAGTDIKVTSGLLGHSTIAITADLYTHVAEKVDHQASARLDAFLRVDEGAQ